MPEDKKNNMGKLLAALFLGIIIGGGFMEYRYENLMKSRLTALSDLCTSIKDDLSYTNVLLEDRNNPSQIRTP